MLEGLSLTTPEMDLIEKVDKNNEFGPLEDGYLYYWPNQNGGCLSSWELRTIADELDKRNKPWHDQVMADFDRMSKEAGMEDAP